MFPALPDGDRFRERFVAVSAGLGVTSDGGTGSAGDDGRQHCRGRARDPGHSMMPRHPEPAVSQPLGVDGASDCAAQRLGLGFAGAGPGVVQRGEVWLIDHEKCSTCGRDIVLGARLGLADAGRYIGDRDLLTAWCQLLTVTTFVVLLSTVDNGSQC